MKGSRDCLEGMAKEEIQGLLAPRESLVCRDCLVCQEKRVKEASKELKGPRETEEVTA